MDINNQIETMQQQKDKMDEKGRIMLNGFEFIITPIFIGEEEKFRNDVTFSALPRKENKDEDFTDKELSDHMITIFANQAFEKKENKCKIITNKKAIKIIKKFSKKHYYADKYAKPLVYWLQQKIRYKDKLVKFYDLERKFKLSKSDIGKIIVTLYKISGF